MENNEIDRQYLGQVLISRGFMDWMLYMFRVITNKPFKVEAIHPDLFQTFQDIYDGKIKRININLPPRAGKTTLNEWFLIYCITKNPRCNFIYTSFNQGLLSDISREIMNILENPIYKAMYPSNNHMEQVESNPVDSFWREYLEQEQKTNVYSNRKIVTAQGGVLLFAAIGSAITGFGCGIRGAKEFSGALQIDDANKPGDIHSQLMRDKVLRYFSETLLSRPNDSNVPIINVQQRLHIEDLAGHLITKYHFQTLRKPLIDHNGVCQIPSQYTPERIKELEFDESAWSAQYQQEPTAEKGLLVKKDWWRFFNPDEEKCTGQIIITADTAFKETKTADFSCIQVWELRRDKMLMRDMLVDKWEFPELIGNAKMMWQKWTNPSMENQARYFFIEDKASGTPLQQTLSREDIEAIAWSPKEYEYPDDKVARTKTASWDVFCGKVYLPKDNRMSEYLVNEASLFAEDMSHSHDDACFVSTTTVQTKHGDKQISDLKVGDYVVTPFGYSKIIKTHVRKKKVITNIGLIGTPDHKVYCANDYKFDKLENMCYDNVSKFNVKGLTKWALENAYYSTETSSTLIKRQDISNLRMTIEQKNVQQKGFIGRCISFIRDRKYRKAIMFIIRMGINEITALKTLSFYHLANTLNGTVRKMRNVGNVLKCVKQTQEEGKNASCGITPKKEENGILITRKNTLKNATSPKYALTADVNSTHQTTIENKRCVVNVGTNTSKENSEERTVYNITVEAGCYYANGILVSNCDAFSMAHSIWKYYGGGQ